MKSIFFKRNLHVKGKRHLIQFLFQKLFHLFGPIDVFARSIILYFTPSIFQPSLIGSCGVPMKSVLKSESLFVERELEVRESLNKNSSINSSIHKSDMDGLYGNLKVSIIVFCIYSN